MRIAIDLQGAQGATSRGRGIGRYSVALAQAMARNHGEHEVLIALNGMFPDSIAPIRTAFEGLLPSENIRVWQAVSPVRALDDANSWRRETAKLMRETFLLSLEPDVVHITSLFEGYGDDAVHSIGAIAAHLPVAVTVYDLIPLLQSDSYLTPHPHYEAFYREQLGYLKHADLCLGISESACGEVVQHLGMPAERVVNVAAAAEPQFQPIDLTAHQKETFLARFGVRGSFVLYSGASDERKNHLRLIKAFATLPDHIRRQHQLVFVGHLPAEHREKFEQHARACGLGSSELIITGRVSDQDLVWFYNLCDLFVFPSWHEGFGLPALEAMSCGAPVVGSNTSSVPEVIGRDDALFDPFDEEAICQKMTEALTSTALRAEWSAHGLQQAKKFSWDESAKRSLRAFEGLHRQHPRQAAAGVSQQEALSETLVAHVASQDASTTDAEDWLLTARAMAHNFFQAGAVASGNGSPPVCRARHKAQEANAVVDETVGLSRKSSRVLASDFEELLSHDDEMFVACAYHTLLGRAPDPEGMQYHVERLRYGVSKIRMLAQLHNSSEGRAVQANVKGLDTALKAHQRSRLPLVGRVFQRWAGHPEEKMTQEVRARRNQLYRLDVQTTQRTAALELDALAIRYMQQKQGQAMPGEAGCPDLPSSMDPRKQFPPVVRDFLFRLRDASLRSYRRAGQ